MIVARAGSAAAAQSPPGRLTLETGKQIYDSGCAACHGADGKGAPPGAVGFDTPVPDFTDCGFSSPEPAPDWIEIVRLGGAARAFDRMMPAFGDALSTNEIADVVDYVRGFCTDRAWPRGDLNLPRPLATEKAFPENEFIVTTTVSRRQPDSVESQFVYERRIGARSQWEVAVPFALQQGAAGWNRGLGDIAVAFKHVLFDSLSRGAILSAGSEVVLPTGKEELGLGGGNTILEPFATHSQMLPGDGFFHLHGGFEFPLGDGIAHDEIFGRAALGKTFTRGQWGRAWSPMVEVLGARELGSDEAATWDLLPQMQVSLSRRQHILFNGGVRIPLNQRSRRHTTVVMYLLWDWFDGALLDGWR